MSPCKNKEHDCKPTRLFRFDDLDSDTSSISLSKIASEVSLCRSEDVKRMMKVHPVYATYAPPGPNAYIKKSCTGFKDHDPTKRVMPAYSFYRDVRFRKTPEPPEPFCETDFKRRVCYKCCTIPKYVPVEKISDVPGSNHYNVLPCYKFIERQAPKYTFGYRMYKEVERKPGPTDYYSPGAKYYPWNPGFTMGIRDNHNSYFRDICKTPAAFAVDPTSVLRSAPAYSMGKILQPLVKGKSPGPSTYRPECVFSNKKRSPKYTFGIKHSKYKVTPIILC